MPKFYTEEEAVVAIKKLLSKKMLLFARRTVHEALREYPDSRQIRFLNAHIASELRDWNAAIVILEKLNKETPDKRELLKALAEAWNYAGGMEKAIFYNSRLHALTGNKNKEVLTKADIYERNNKLELAEKEFAKLPQNVLGQIQNIILRSRILIAKKDFESAVDLIKSCEDRLSELDEPGHISVMFMLTKAYDKLGEYDKAWVTAEKAHSLSTIPFDIDRYFDQFVEMREVMSNGILDALVEGPKTEIEPLFIVGNPRSGTSLLEQIMSMHPDIENGGEMSVGMSMQLDIPTLTDSFHEWPNNLVDLRADDAAKLAEMYLEAVEYSRNGERVVSNKALNLPVQVGFLSKVLPSSRAIILHRHPLDNAVSCYTTNLLSAGHPYTNDLRHLGLVWIERKKMADMWVESLSIPVMELHYENLVADQRGETERIIEFLGLPWQEDCMEFHKSKRVAKTISYDQVNKKMYKTSSGRWKNYEKHLGPLMDIVSDYI
ncbi:MAG: hypothetical protein HOC93_01990 [Phycisphaerae bacterium]|jgi:hypothetical protein|nr:hypothetical protein [Phycisphaerae bacterium]